MPILGVRSGARFLVLLFVLVLAGLGRPGTARAQGDAQVLLIGVPPLLSAPLLADIERDYEAGLFPLQFIYNNPTGGAVEFQFRLVIELEGLVILDVMSDPVTYTSGVYFYRTFDDPPAVFFPGGYDGLLAALDPGVRDQIEQSGRLPEGNYLLILEAVPTDRMLLIASVPGMAFFTVRYAEPPLLLTPPDHAIVAEALPVFSWTPAIGLPPGTTAEYNLRIVEVIPGQTPLQALEGNIPHVETTLTGITTFSYLPGELPLNYGRLYVWQVIARDVAGQVPFTNNGETEIFTFSYGEGAGGVVWRYPASNPFIEFPINDPVVFSRGLQVDGDYVGTVAGEAMNATFEGVLLHPETHQLLAGTVTLASGVTIGPGE